MADKSNTTNATELLDKICSGGTITPQDLGAPTANTQATTYLTEGGETMKYISEKEYNAEMLRIKRDNESKARQRKLKAERAKGHPKSPRKISNSKLVLWAMVALVFCIAIWFMYESHRLCDLSQAYALLGIVASLAPVIFGYYSKSKAENTEGGIVYETAMKEQETTNSESGKG